VVSTVEERAHRNLCDFTRFTARLDRGGRVFDEGGVVALIGSADWPSSRTAVRSDHVVSPSAWVDTVRAVFDAHGKTGCVFARVGVDDDLGDELVARDFAEWAHTPEMVSRERWSCCSATIGPATSAGLRVSTRRAAVGWATS
jgi:hypothetical protein